MSETNQKPKSSLSSLIAILTQSGKWAYVLIFGLAFYLGVQFASKSSKDNSTIEYDTRLIQEQIKNVGKLVVTEGHFSQVMTYKDQKKYLLDMISFDKKALVVVNADVTVGFDLSKIKYNIDAKNKVVSITHIPEAELKISPDIKYYNVDQSTFNEFTGDDYNKINKIARENLTQKIAKSTLKSNAKNRLVSELSKILIVTRSMGWKLNYDGQELNTENAMIKQFATFANE
jgi:lipopolysaccharide export LptBFGC system permease protein LptF